MYNFGGFVQRRPGGGGDSQFERRKRMNHEWNQRRKKEDVFLLPLFKLRIAEGLLSDCGNCTV
jgi:hypothetical protein